jgi:hypothetical protein
MHHFLNTFPYTFQHFQCLYFKSSCWNIISCFLKICQENLFYFLLLLIIWLLCLETVQIGNRRRSITRYLARCAEVAARDTDTSSLKSLLKLVPHCWACHTWKHPYRKLRRDDFRPGVINTIIITYLQVKDLRSNASLVCFPFKTLCIQLRQLP